jgi:4-hydroxy-tetrahydrodipicolinate synthase
MITGSIVALVTPMRSSSFAVDWEALSSLIEWHIAQGTSAIVAVGTTGESATLTVHEHAKVIEFVISEVARRIPVIAGTGANSTTEAIDLTSMARDVGADASLVVTPYYNKPTQTGLIEHYSAIANSVDIKQILYNVPSRTACDMLPETIIELSKIDNIVGVKEATGDLSRVKLLLSSCEDNFGIYSGDDATAKELMLMGGHGDISVTANVAPKLMAEMCHAALKGDSELATHIDNQLKDLHSSLFLEANPIPVKWALNRLKKIENALRLPMTELSPHLKQHVEMALKTASVL